MASVRSIDDALSLTLTTNGRVLRNLIHGADTVMSHILHFYHLSAADFVDISPAAGVLGSPWDDGLGTGGHAFGATSDCKFVSLTQVVALANATNGRVTGELVESYVMALNMRKEAHTMGAIFSGRQPIQNAIVPGGVSTLFTASDVLNFRGKLNTIRNFINRYYIPDVVYVATRSTGAGLGEDWSKYWFVGTNPGLLLSYGDYPLSGAEAPFRTITDNDKMLIARGLSTYNSTALATFHSASIAEYVDYSYYSSPTGLHPSVGVTTPDVSLVSSTSAHNQYSWLKAPRYGGNSAEVGPLARMFATYLSTTTREGLAACPKVVEAQSYSLGNIHSALSLPAAGYTAAQLVDAALAVVSAVANTTVGVFQLFSPLGRHAARALECKYVADAMYSWLDDLTLNHDTTSVATGAGAYTATFKTGSGYVEHTMPKAISYGEGLAEAPRGALGHWIKIANKKIANYQCVVPSTWNCGPKGGTGAQRGPAESVLQGIVASASHNADDAICNIARMLHPYDFCIACAVHVVAPDGKEITKFEMGLDGKTKKL